MRSTLLNDGEAGPLNTTHTAANESTPEGATKNLVSISPFFIVKDLQASIGVTVNAPHGPAFAATVGAAGAAVAGASSPNEPLSRYTEPTTSQGMVNSANVPINHRRGRWTTCASGVSGFLAMGAIPASAEEIVLKMAVPDWPPTRTRSGCTRLSPT